MFVGKPSHIFSAVAISEPANHKSACFPYQAMRISLPINVVTSLLRTWQISSGTNQIVAPNFRAILMLNFALA
jgi:hypothetical protein